MLTDDIYVRTRTDDEIAGLALSMRTVLGVPNEAPAPDVLLSLENELPRYIEQFALLPVADGSLGRGRPARASFRPPKIEIENSSYVRLSLGQAQARFDAAHELGHLILHNDGPATLAKNRTAGNIVYVARSDMSGEKQADQFSAEFLAPQHIVRLCGSWEEVAEWCLIPPTWAKDVFRRYGENRRVVLPTSLQDKFRKLNED